jgi:hypothetical protein
MTAFCFHRVAQARGNGEWASGRVGVSEVSERPTTPERVHPAKAPTERLKTGADKLGVEKEVLGAPSFSPYRSSASYRPFAPSPVRPFAHSPIRPIALSPYRLLATSEIPIVLDVALADDFPSAVNQEELAEFIVLVLQVDCPIPASGGSGIGTPG